MILFVLVGVVAEGFVIVIAVVVVVTAESVVATADAVLVVVVEATGVAAFGIVDGGFTAAVVEFVLFAMTGGAASTGRPSSDKFLRNSCATDGELVVSVAAVALLLTVLDFVLSAKSTGFPVCGFLNTSIFFSLGCNLGAGDV